MDYLGFPGLKPHPVQGVIVARTTRHVHRNTSEKTVTSI
jgi:hypothetical protein